MYHADAHEAVPNGLFGTMYVGDVPSPAGETVSGFEIPADLEIAQDVPMVLNDAGVIGLSLDGKSFPATAPIVAEVGDWLRLTYFNEGLQVHPMHLHGFEQIVVAKDGEPLDHPYAADTVLVAPGERYTVLVNPTVAGTWVWHCHPQPRRVGRRYVRHGHRPRRPVTFTGARAEVARQWDELTSVEENAELFAPGSACGLPPPVQRWLLRSLAPGTPLRHRAVFHIDGEIRLGRWRRFTGR